MLTGKHIDRKFNHNCSTDLMKTLHQYFWSATHIKYLTDYTQYRCYEIFRITYQLLCKWILFTGNSIFIVLFSVTCCFSRKKYPLDGSDDEVIMADLRNHTSIAIDTESDHLYLLYNFPDGTLLRSDLDGSNRLEILTGLYYSLAIALDTVNT